MTPSAEASAADEARLRTFRLGVTLFLFADGMLFAGLVGAVIVLRAGFPLWAEEMMSPFSPSWSQAIWGIGAIVFLWRAVRRLREGKDEDRMLLLAQWAFLILLIDLGSGGWASLREASGHPLSLAASTELALAGVLAFHLLLANVAIFACRTVSLPRRAAWVEVLAPCGYFTAGTGLLLAGLFHALR